MSLEACCGADLGGGRLAFRFEEVGEDDPGSLGGEEPGGRRTLAAGLIEDAAAAPNAASRNRALLTAASVLKGGVA